MKQQNSVGVPFQDAFHLCGSSLKKQILEFDKRNLEIL